MTTGVIPRDLEREVAKVVPAYSRDGNFPLAQSFDTIHGTLVHTTINLGPHASDV